MPPPQSFATILKMDTLLIATGIRRQEFKLLQSVFVFLKFKVCSMNIFIYIKYSSLSIHIEHLKITVEMAVFHKHI